MTFRLSKLWPLSEIKEASNQTVHYYGGWRVVSRVTERCVLRSVITAQLYKVTPIIGPHRILQMAIVIALVDNNNKMWNFTLKISFKMQFLS